MAKKEASCPLCRGTLGDVEYSPEDVIQSKNLHLHGFRRNFVMRPVPSDAGVLRCYVRVISDDSSSYPRFEMWLQGASTLRYPAGPLPRSDEPAQGDRILLHARPRRKMGFGMSSRVDISLYDEKEDGSAARNILANVRSSFLGLEHTLVAPLSVPGVGSTHGNVGAGERELLGVTYTQNRLGLAIGPRQMNVAMPEVEVDGDNDTIPLYRPTQKSHTMTAQLREPSPSFATTPSPLVFFKNKEPQWLEAIGAHTLDFRGRVLTASNKNFQLIQPSDQNTVLCQFGKVHEDKELSIYTTDIQYPISPVQAFGLCISSCMRKLACA